MKFDGQVWAPVAMTPPLSPAFTTDGDKVIRMVEKYWKTPEGALTLDPWQKALIRHVLETYPPGHPLAGRLRYRQCVVSMGRQNGKSVIAAIFSLYGLVQQTSGPSVIGVASNREQANIIYNRTKYVVINTPALSKKIKATGTRGLNFRDGSGSYEIRASKSDALQGIPITLALCDELHILETGVWDSLVNGTRAQTNAMVLGISTAGDDASDLLKRLYKAGEEAIEGDNERFGFFLWEAPEGSTIDTPGAIEAANPAIASGRIDVETVRADVRNLPEPDQQRYTLNRFIASINPWLPMNAWYACATGGIPQGAKDLVISMDRTASWEYASVMATAKVDGKLYTQPIAYLVNPAPEQLIAICKELYKKHKPTFVMDTFTMGSAVGNPLKDKGYEVYKLTSHEIAQASSLAYSNIIQQKVSTPKIAGGLLNEQMPRAKRKNVGEGWRVAKSESSIGEDAVMAMVMGLYVADTKPAKVVQLF